MKLQETIKTGQGKYAKEVGTDWMGTFTRRIDLGVSEIYSALVREAGRLCENYASDVIHLIKSIERTAENMIDEWDPNAVADDGGPTSPMHFTYWIGFRKSGVNWFSDVSAYGEVWKMIDIWKEDRDYITRYILSVGFDREGHASMNITRFN